MRVLLGSTLRLQEQVSAPFVQLVPFLKELRRVVDHVHIPSTWVVLIAHQVTITPFKEFLINKLMVLM